MGEVDLVINEIFTAPQGEGLFTGMPMVFVRLQGCNLRCLFCDTTEAIGREAVDPAVQHWEPVDLAKRLVVEYGDNRVVCFTGGEPLIQICEVITVAEILHDHGWMVHLETNGTITILEGNLQHFDWITASPKGPQWTLAIPGRAVNELKFIMPPEEEYHADVDSRKWASPLTIEYAMNMCPEAFVWLQPRNNEPKAIEWCLRMLEGVRVQLRPAPLTMGLSVQVHKYIGSR